VGLVINASKIHITTLTKIRSLARETCWIRSDGLFPTLLKVRLLGELNAKNQIKVGRTSFPNWGLNYNPRKRFPSISLRCLSVEFVSVDSQKHRCRDEFGALSRVWVGAQNSTSPATTISLSIKKFYLLEFLKMQCKSINSLDTE
jgi:hypothetical protein